MQIAEGTVVSIDYTLKNKHGEVLDSSAGNEPLAFIQGAGQIIPGLEKALEGKAEGDKLQTKIAPEAAYGARDDALIVTLPKDRFRGVEAIEAGMQFQASTPQGPRLMTVQKVEGEHVTVDGNHPLAGEELDFDVTVRGVREATEEEMSHGHVHGPGGHSH